MHHLHYDRDKVDETGGDDDQAFNCSGVQPQLEKQTTTSIKHLRTRSDSDDSLNACTENAITVQLRTPLL